MKRDQTKLLRFTAEEFQKLILLAKERNMDLSEYIRFCAFNPPKIVPKSKV